MARPAKEKLQTETGPAIGVGDKVRWAKFEGTKRVTRPLKATVTAINGFGHMTLSNGMTFNKEGVRRVPHMSAAANAKAHGERLVA